MHITTNALDHHGIVCGVFDELEIGSIIDEALPKVGQHKLAHSIVIKAMILNCLGFTDSRLYLYSQYFENLPVERLLGPGVSASDLTDDVLGRTLDKIYEADPTQLFMKLSMKMMEIVYPLQIKWIFNRRKNIIVIPFTLIISWSHKMELEALKQLLASLDINPDEIEDKRYATAFRILFSIVEKQNEEMGFLKADNQKFRDEINLLKGEQTKPKIRGSKKNEDISSEKERHKRRCL